MTDFRALTSAGPAFREASVPMRDFAAFANHRTFGTRTRRDQDRGAEGICALLLDQALRVARFERRQSLVSQPAGAQTSFAALKFPVMSESLS